MTAALIGVGVSIFVSALVVARGYGKLEQKVADVDDRLRRVENHLVLLWEPGHEKR